MYRSLAVALVVFLLAASGSGCNSHGLSARDRPFANEQQWLVHSIGKDVAGLVLFAASKKNAAVDLDNFSLITNVEGGDYGYVLQYGNGSNPERGKIRLSQYVWNPANYSPWVEQLAKKFGVAMPATDSRDSGKLISALANFTPGLLSDNNKAIGAALSASPLDANLNEQAALLCAVYALRETAACFTDTRSWLDRTTAHLAVARAARKNQPFSQAGQLAQAVAQCLSGREAEAIKAVTAMENIKSDQAMDSWLRAIKIRATHDFRIAKLDGSTLIERLEYGRALANCLSSDALTDYLTKAHITDAGVDWMRIGMRGIESVESGHIYSENSVSAELADSASDLRLYKGLNAKSLPELLSQLGEFPSICLVKNSTWQLEPVSWGDLSDFHNRHLLDAVYQTYRFVYSMWGVPERAKQLRDWFEKHCAELPLYSFCKLNLQLQKGDNPDGDTSAAVGAEIKKHPERINADLWLLAQHHCGSAVPPRDNWFSPLYPFGTAFDYDNRYFSHNTSAQLEHLRALSPYSIELDFDYAKKQYGENFNADQLASAYGTLLAYNVHAMESVADRALFNQKDQYGKRLEAMCQFQPNTYYILGSYYESKQPDKALVAYEKAVASGRDDVLFANNCGWLVDYYYSHGNQDKALKLATRAAEVWSFRGLATMARLQERMKKLDQSEKYYQAIKQRYDSSSELCAFYLRHQAENPQYKEQASKLLQEIYPGGFTRLNSATLKKAPKEGIQITSTNIRTDEAGIHEGAIVVGVNGCIVKNKKQYALACEMSSTATIEYVFWDQGSYKTAKVLLPGRRLGCDIEDYKAQG